MRLVRASQFFCQFCFLVCHKPGKEYIVSDAFSKLVSANINYSLSDPNYEELNALFIYNTTLIKINPELLQRIVNGYKADSWQSKLLKQVKTNQALGLDAAFLLFVLSKMPVSDSNPYFGSRPETTINESSSELRSEISINQLKNLEPSKVRSTSPLSHSHLEFQMRYHSVFPLVLDSPVLLDKYKNYDKLLGNRYTKNNLLYHINWITVVC